MTVKKTTRTIHSTQKATGKPATNHKATVAALANALAASKGGEDTKAIVKAIKSKLAGLAAEGDDEVLHTGTVVSDEVREQRRRLRHTLRKERIAILSHYRGDYEQELAECKKSVGILIPHANKIRAGVRDPNWEDRDDVKRYNKEINEAFKTQTHEVSYVNAAIGLIEESIRRHHAGLGLKEKHSAPKLIHDGKVNVRRAIRFFVASMATFMHMSNVKYERDHGEAKSGVQLEIKRYFENRRALEDLHDHKRAPRATGPHKGHKSHAAQRG